jgi:hypothetical protein
LEVTSLLNPVVPDGSGSPAFTVKRAVTAVGVVAVAAGTVTARVQGLPGSAGATQQGARPTAAGPVYVVLAGTMSVRRGVAGEPPWCRARPERLSAATNTPRLTCFAASAREDIWFRIRSPTGRTRRA